MIFISDQLGILNLVDHPDQIWSVYIAEYQKLGDVVSSFEQLFLYNKSFILYEGLDNIEIVYEKH